jgi:hypothetical protein
MGASQVEDQAGGGEGIVLTRFQKSVVYSSWNEFSSRFETEPTTSSELQTALCLEQPTGPGRRILSVVWTIV